MRKHIKQQIAAVGLLTVACSHTPQPTNDPMAMSKKQAQESADRLNRNAKEHGQCGTVEVVQAGKQWHEVWTPKGCPKQELDALNGKMDMEFMAKPERDVAHKQVHTIDR
jgi:hypothetical protein